MAIESKELKKLWGLAAGKCAGPACKTDDCVVFLSDGSGVTLGEMAHIIAKRPEGPRGQSSGGSDTYDNLILLCPNHHTLIDKAPNEFPEEMLRGWKSAHEQRVKRALEAPAISSKGELFRRISHLLIENHQIWKRFGPESEEAARNPASSAAETWSLRKLNVVVPNNRVIISLLTTNKQMMSSDEYRVARGFVEHAEAFEANCYERREAVR